MTYRPTDIEVTPDMINAGAIISGGVLDPGSRAIVAAIYRHMEATRRNRALWNRFWDWLLPDETDQEWLDRQW